jgi:carboxymethylenebutenolidase
VPAYLARPNRPGTFPTVIVIHANWLSEPYIAETTSLLAEAGFVALAIDLFHFYPAEYSWEEAQRVPGATIRETLQREFRERRMVSDIAAGAAFLYSLPYARKGSVGLIGFCGGGWNALLAAAQLDGIGAVVAFYTPVAEADDQHRAPLALAQYISAPVQYHQPANDEYVPSVDVDRFERAVKEAGTRFDRYVYPGARHGFFAFDRAPVFSEEAANLAWRRMVPFLHETLSEPVRAHRSAPAASSQEEQGQPNQGAMSPLHQH